MKFPQLYGMRSVLSRLVLFEDEFIILIAIIIVLTVHFLHAIVIIASCCGFTELGMLTHGICTWGKVVQTVGTNEAQVVMDSPQMLYHGPLILTGLPTPRAESYATLSLEGLG